MLLELNVDKKYSYHFLPKIEWIKLPEVYRITFILKYNLESKVMIKLKYIFSYLSISYMYYFYISI